MAETFSKEERAAMRERARELKAQAKSDDWAADMLAKIEEMPEPDRTQAKRIHELVTEHAPTLLPKAWYGMPGYANKDGKIVCFMQGASKFDTRYSTFGFNDIAVVDDGTMWPTAFGFTELTAADEAELVRLIKRAAAAQE